MAGINPLDLVQLTKLREITCGRKEIVIGLIDGPIAKAHSALSYENIWDISGQQNGQCTQTNEKACLHGTFVAGILCGKRDSISPALCPNCTLLVRSIFSENPEQNGQLPISSVEELAVAIIEIIKEGARVLNLSIGLAQPSSKGEGILTEALDYAIRSGAIVVAAAGNQGVLGSSIITRHPGVIPVAACDFQGRPMGQSNLGISIGRRGLSAPGDNITSLGIEGKPIKLSGTSVATPFVTGAIALLWSAFPTATVAEVKFVITTSHKQQRTSIVPPLLNGWAAYQTMRKSYATRR